MSSAQVDEKAPVRTAMVVVLLVLAAIVGAGPALFNYAFNVAYGPTSGSWIDGAVTALIGIPGAPLLLCAVLAGVAFFLGRHATWARALAVAVVSLSAVAVFVGGGQAALAKYDRLPRVPNCGSAAEGSPPGALAVAAEFARLEHPAPFGASWYGVDGCGSNVMNVNFAEAADHYRAQLPATGWTITRDTSSELAASRGDLTFVLVVRCEQLAVEIKRAGTTSPNSC